MFAPASEAEYARVPSSAVPATKPHAFATTARPSPNRPSNGQPDSVPEPGKAADPRTFLANLAPGAGLLAAALGIMTLIGWAADIDVLKAVVPGLVTMKPNDGIGFILLGFALFLMSAIPVHALGPRKVANALAFLTALMGFFTLIEYSFAVNLGIDNLVPVAQALGGNRMAPLSAFNFVLLAGALILVDRTTPRGYRPSQLLAIASGALSLEVLLNYAYGSRFQYLGQYTFVALHTAVAFLAVSLGVFFLNPTAGLAGEVTSPSPGGLVLRRMLLAVVCLLPVLGCFRAITDKAALIDSAHATTLMVLMSLATFSVLVWRTAKALNEANQSRTAAEDALRHRNNELTDFFENASVGITWVGADGIIQWANRTELELLGYRRDEYIGRHVSEFHADPEQSREVVGRWTRGEEVHNRAMRLLCKDGSIRTLEINCGPYWRNGQFIHTRCFNRDVTQRKAAEQALRLSEQKLSAIFNQVTVGIVQAETDGRLILMNDRFCQLSGWSRERLLTMRIEDITHPDDLPSIMPAFRKIVSDGADCVIEQRYIRPNGASVWVRGSVAPIKDESGRIHNIVAVVEDITERKKAEAALRQDIMERRKAEDEVRRLNAELDQRVRQRTAQLESTNKELEAFCYSVSHDLRAPLRNVIGFSQALLQDYAGKLDDQGKEYLNRTCAAGQRMSRLIEDLLHLSRVGRTEMSHNKVDLSALVQFVATEMQKSEPGREVTWKIAPGVAANGDQRLLRIAFENLLGNAWKFTAKKPTAIIEFGQERRENDTVFFVRDNGAGFDMTYADKLFGVFQRLHSAAEFPGTGIGLATVQRIINRHCGRIWAESEIGNGATFYFTLPDGEAESAG